MPGLNQLKQFISDIHDLGNESEIRQQRGEKVSDIDLPDTYEEDDSEEFLIGLPEKGRGEGGDDEDAVKEGADGSDDSLDSLDALPDGDLSAVDDLGLDTLGTMDDLDDFLNETEPATQPAPAPSASDESAAIDDLGDLSDLDNLDDIAPVSDGAGDTPAASDDDFAYSGSEINMNEGLPDEIAETDAGSDLRADDNAAADATSLDLDNLSGEASAADSSGDIADIADISDFSEMPPADGGSGAEESSGRDDVGDILSDLGDFGSADSADTSSIEKSSSGVEEFDPDSLDIDSIVGSSDSAGGDAVPEVFDTAELDSADFSDEPSEPKKSDGEEFPTTEDGFDLYSDFEIEGFTDTETAEIKKKPAVDTVDFSNAPTKPKNTLTDEEYVKFKENLASYPLNLKVALEEFFADPEFTDDTVFEIVEKVLKKATARSLAGQLEKLTEKSIPIPRDFERRSYAQYEAYKQSFQYQLKNRIIPGAIVAILALLIGFGLFKASVRFIYKPAMATKYYKQGYALLENNEFPQSELKFQEAVSYKPIKKWFFNYARGYREKKQFERAAAMYKKILRYFRQDKQAGLEYAQMELYDRANFALAENIVRREVLDYYVNDADAILLLGDIFMEWAEVEPEKYELAKEQYLLLIDLYGIQNVYQARMLRYYVHTDKLRDVLVYKNIFYPKQSSLEAADWILLSDYLLERLYGPLSKNNEYLRASIEDVRGMLEMAIKADPTSPVARYNFARYFVYNGYIPQAKSEFEICLDLFAKQKKRTKKDTYKEINATRMLGEIYSDEREYLKAQDIFTRGIKLFKDENEKSGLEGDENTGILFADMGDIDYFITGDLDTAMENYDSAIKSSYNPPSMRYKMGAISYGRKDFDNALDYFTGIAHEKGDDVNLLLALGNTLSIRGDDFAAQSYYEDLINELDHERRKMGIVSPQNNEDDYALVDSYLKANNNLGVTLYRLAKQTGNSGMYGRAIVKLSESARAWDSLTRNPDTMVRLDGSNLATQNVKYITHPVPEFEPSIYTDIPRILVGDKVLD